MFVVAVNGHTQRQGEKPAVMANVCGLPTVILERNYLW